MVTNCMAKRSFLFDSFVVEHQDGSRHVHNIPVVKLKEGEQVSIMKRGTPHFLTARLELLEPALA